MKREIVALDSTCTCWAKYLVKFQKSAALKITFTFKSSLPSLPTTK